MLRLKYTILLFISLVASFKMSAVSPYPQLQEKAARAFAHAEWASASAFYDLMLDARPDVPDTYGQAIVANAMRDDRAAQMRLMQQALDNHIPFDSVFTRVRQWSFHIGKTRLFEEFLLDTREGHPWMRRTIDAYLLKYYVFRRDGEKMVAYSKTMLAGAPENVEFLTTLAEGYMLEGAEIDGVAAYRRILEIDPRNFNALLNLGNYYALKPDEPSHGIAVEFLERAYAVHATPYVATTLQKLRDDGK